MVHQKTEFGYRLWDPKNRKIIRSRDVVFFDNQTIEDIQRSKKPKLKVSKNIEHHQSGDNSEETIDDGENDHE